MILNLLISIIIPSLQSLVAANLTECLEECGTSSIFFSDAIETRVCNIYFWNELLQPSIKATYCPTGIRGNSTLCGDSSVLWVNHRKVARMRYHNPVFRGDHCQILYSYRFPLFALQTKVGE